MPKMKTKKSAAKRYKITGSGKISYSKGGNSHFGVRKSSKRNQINETYGLAIRTFTLLSTAQEVFRGAR